MFPALSSIFGESPRSLLFSLLIFDRLNSLHSSSFVKTLGSSVAKDKKYGMLGLQTVNKEILGLP